MLSPEQSRAARGWLDWSQSDLASHAHVSLSTVRDFEKGRRTPIANNIGAIRTALEAAGVQMVFGKDGSATGIVGVCRPSQKERPPADAPRRRPGPQGRKVASPKSRR
jgi:predicted transcriptional regulator